MSPRPRAIPDSDILAATARVAARAGVERLRLADVAVEIGLAPPTLIQRFGSREGLLTALGEEYVREVGRAFRLPASSELGRLEDALLGLNTHHHLVFLGARPECGAAYVLAVRKEIALALVAAIEAGELVRCDVAYQARRIQLSYFGYVTTAMLEAEPISLEPIHQLLDEVLADYR